MPRFADSVKDTLPESPAAFLHLRLQMPTPNPWHTTDGPTVKNEEGLAAYEEKMRALRLALGPNPGLITRARGAVSLEDAERETGISLRR